MGSETKIASEILSAEDKHPVWWFDDIDAAQRYDGVRNWTKPAVLQGSEDYLIDPTVDKIRMGLGWDKGADIDASVALFDEHLRAVDCVWYKQLQSKCGSVVHYGNAVTEVATGDDEVVSVKLSEVPLHVHYLLFSMCVFSHDLCFNDVKSAHIRMMNGKKKYKRCEMFKFTMTKMSGHAMIIGALTRKGPLWNFKTLEIPATGRSILELMQNDEILQSLSEIPTSNPVQRHVTVTVLKGRNLAAKDFSFFGSRSSDPYYVMKFKKKTLKSEYRAQTLRPEWKVSSLEMGFITAAETKPLRIEIFDYDMLSSDDFMGAIAIPAHALYALGLGRHTFWVLLGDVKKKTKEEISGDILVQFDVNECA